MIPENPAGSFAAYREHARRIFASFPNERVWQQGGLRPNRQVQNPEAGYCLVLRYDAAVTAPVARFLGELRLILPSMLAYRESDLHSTIGTYGKGDLRAFAPQPAVLAALAEAVEKGIGNRSPDLRIAFGRWGYNAEAILVPGYPNRALWQLCQDIGRACRDRGYPLDMAQIMHITTARFTGPVSRQEFEQFSWAMRGAPKLPSARPWVVDLAAWHCDGRAFDLAVHRRYRW